MRTIDLLANSRDGALRSLAAHLENEWEPGPREGRGLRPIAADLMRSVDGETTRVGRVQWVIDGVVEIDLVSGARRSLI